MDNNFTKSKLFQRYPILDGIKKDIQDALGLLVKSYEQEGKVLAMGNGGGSADSEHLCGELMKGFLSKRPVTSEEKKMFDKIDPEFAKKLQRPLPAVSLVVGHAAISAFSNDVDPDLIFAQQIFGLAKKQDVVIGISTSGNSRNVIWGLKAAKALGVPSIALTGEAGGECNKWADIVIRAPSKVTHEVQEFHLPIYHALCIELEVHFFGE